MAKKRRRKAWRKLPLEQLLDVRLCDLDVQIKGSVVQQRIEQVLGELERREITFRPHFWVSDDWFTPAGVSGCAIPFYLLHPRLRDLERKQMLEVEGSERSECVKILRHEVGHAIDHAYRLNLRKKRQRLFGRSTKTYPDAYMPRPFSRSFVQNIDYWYAQSHPDEDFAETFAVWLGPRSNWRKIYQGWPAMKKLVYMDELIKEIAGIKPSKVSRQHISPLTKDRRTLRQYYTEKQERYETEYPNFYDADLLRLFSAEPKYKKNETAASFLRRVRPSIRNMVSQWTGHYAYSLDQVLKDIIGRCRELKLRVNSPKKQLEMDAAIMLTVNTMNFLYSGRRWVDL